MRFSELTLRSLARRRTWSWPTSSSITSPVTSTERLPCPAAACSIDSMIASIEVPLTR